MPRRLDSPWRVYMLSCSDGSLYTGITNDLERRLERHQAGKGAAYTRSRLPVALVYTEPAQDRGQALSREAALKKLSRSQKLALVRALSTRRRRLPVPQAAAPRASSPRRSTRTKAL